MARVVIPGFRKIEIRGGEGGTTNYNDLENKPFINNVPLVGNLRTANLKLTDATLTEEGVPAEAKTVGTKLEEHSTSLTTLNKETTVNLLKPTMATTTFHGVTLTNNSDGTFSLNGTGDGDSYFTLYKGNLPQGELKLVGCPNGGGTRKYLIRLGKGEKDTYVNFDIGDGITFDSDGGVYVIKIHFYKEKTYDNLVFKPMLTTNLNATYDDFVPYTGDGDTLMDDAASLLRRIEALEYLVNKTDTTNATITE